MKKTFAKIMSISIVFICYLLFNNFQIAYAITPSQEQEISRWSKYLSKEMDKSLKKPYQILRDDPNTFEIIYRPDMFDDLIKATINSQISHPQSKINKSHENIYYIPASSYKFANASGKGFKIANENLEILIPPDTFDVDKNTSIQKAELDISKKQCEDYFIRIVVKFPTGYEIKGNHAISNAIDIKFEVVETSIDISRWDAELQNKLADEMAEYSISPRFRDSVAKIVLNYGSDEEKLNHMENILNDRKKKNVDIINLGIKDFLKTTYPIIELNKPINIMVSNSQKADIVKCFEFFIGNWDIRRTYPIGEKQGIYTLYPGIYNFTGQKIDFYSAEKENNIKDCKNIIAKYHLDKFLGTNKINLDASATMEQVIGCITQISSMPEYYISDNSNQLLVDSINQNPYFFNEKYRSEQYVIRGNDTNFNSTNFAISSKDLYKPIQNQEVVHLVMLLYEIKTGNTISTIELDNYASSVDMEDVSPKYEPSIKAAMELGLVSINDFYPLDSITVGKFLELLGNFNEKIEI